MSRSARWIGEDQNRSYKHTGGTYRCDLCGRDEPQPLVEASTVPIMLGVQMEHKEPPSMEFVSPKASDKHICHKCLRCMQVTFRTPAETIVLRNGR